MKTYQVNLPKTSFPMKANLPKREPQVLEFWNEIKLYDSFVNPKDSRGRFVLHDGPPYANGDIHIGHAFNKTIKDVINKSKLLEGYSVSYIPGWDCHGLPIEINVEKKVGKPFKDVTPEKFVQECRKYADDQIQKQMKGFQRLGVTADWENYYSTTDYKYEADIVRALMDIVDSGHVVRGYKPVHWCIACGSALAEAEVEYKDKSSPAIDVKFRVAVPNRFNMENASIPIWTTTPWTLPANEAVCLHPKLKYVLVNCFTLCEKFILAEDLLEDVMSRYGETNYKIENRYSGEELENLELKHPFLTDKVVLVILGDHVTVDAGTGAVHTAPAHGQDDYIVGLKYKLPINNPVGSNGKFLDGTEFFAGEKVFNANDHVIEVLKENNNLIHVDILQHSYPHCWRHKAPLIFRATRQWFVSMDNLTGTNSSLRQMAQSAIGTVDWLPKQGENSIRSMVEQRPDWCISRQRLWGLPMTLFVNKDTGEVHPKMHSFVNDFIAPNIEKDGLIYWHNLDVKKFLEMHDSGNDSDSYEKVKDSLDVWFNSGVSHYCVLKKRKELHFPADVYIEGSDQYRGWFQSSLLTSLCLNNSAPYKTVITHGFCVDANGYKMSKSLGNVISPKQIIDKYGSDIFRLWVGSTYIHDDLAASEEIFARTVDIYRMVRNTARFLLGNLHDFNPKSDLISVDKMLSLDKWAVSRIIELVESARKHYDSYKFHHVYNNLQVVLGNDISSFYFSIIKDRLYTMADSSFGRRSAQTALFYILEFFVRLISPVLSFTAEEIWQEVRKMDEKNGDFSREKSVFMSRWTDIPEYSAFDLSKDKVTSSDWDKIKLCKTEVNKELERLRSNNIIGSSLAADVTLYCDNETSSLLSKLTDDLRFVLITSSAIVSDINLAPKEAVDTEIPGLKILAIQSSNKKCARCWHYRKDVGYSSEHPDLCERCYNNLFETGESRYFA